MAHPRLSNYPLLLCSMLHLRSMTLKSAHVQLIFCNHPGSFASVIISHLSPVRLSATNPIIRLEIHCYTKRTESKFLNFSSYYKLTKYRYLRHLMRFLRNGLCFVDQVNVVCCLLSYCWSTYAPTYVTVSMSFVWWYWFASLSQIKCWKRTEGEAHVETNGDEWSRPSARSLAGVLLTAEWLCSVTKTCHGRN